MLHKISQFEYYFFQKQAMITQFSETCSDVVQNKKKINNKNCLVSKVSIF